MRPLHFAIALMALLAVSCADDEQASTCFFIPQEGGVGASVDACSGRLAVSPGSMVFPFAAPGEELSRFVTIQNTGAAMLTIESTELLETDAADEPELFRGQGWFEYARIEPGQTRSLIVTYRPRDERPAEGSIKLEVEGDAQTTGSYEIPIRARAGEPDIEVVNEIVFPTAGPIDQLENAPFETRTIRNVGTADLVVESADVVGESYRVEFYQTDPSVIVSDEFDIDGHAIAPGETVWFRVFFESSAAGEQIGALRLRTNDPDEPTATVNLTGETLATCMRVVPDSLLQFERAPINGRAAKSVSIQNCSSTTSIAIERIAITDSASERFGLDDLPTELLQDGRYRLLPGDELRFFVTFDPTDDSTVRGALTIRSNATQRGVETLLLEGTGVENVCPEAVATAQVDGMPPQTDLVVQPQTSVLLSGVGSSDPITSITRYEWTIVSQPNGSTGDRLIPSADVVAPTLRVNLYGVYEIRLTVFDAAGLPSCEPAIVRVHVVPSSDLVVMLTWNTPNDLNIGDEFGADLDLHLLRPGGDWNVPADDVHAGNPTADWGAPGPADDPRLLVSDDDGAGPELVELSSPTRGTYGVGVEYEAADSFGASTATARVYIRGEFRGEWSALLTDESQFWHVADVVWGLTPQITAVDSIMTGRP